MVRALTLGVLHALACASIGAFILGLILYATPLSEAWLPLAVLVLSSLAVFWGALQAAHVAGSRGLLHGLGVAVVFLAFVFMLSWPSGNLGLKLVAQRTLFLILAGSMGGVAGVSLR